MEAALSYQENLVKIINEGDYIIQKKKSNVNEIALYWKNKSRRTFTVGKKKLILCFKPFKDRQADSFVRG